ncbi:hypothetical protein PPL_09769 [Heterostelium album PN500]|uniref:G domain-containing protein n=1 Tax=Heterostelium pallidum (strain ATCC 26659 / Pp 5 / PN500) TaxID=670386 RepID=D3BP07_HETP5|nr:hypothetical protein PPL_09769 [Heterostelium album PN500]EFA77017.1 hypothetical protein PPL_09769 [Heterostelium album PN500]|eukprot:XP_020429147.1 hypothetical protein PPL_09769 [Heterostelium album PN500]
MGSISIEDKEIVGEYNTDLFCNNNNLVPDKNVNDFYNESIDMLLKTISKAIEASYITNDQIINLLLGRTGAGKTTITHYLCGEKMVLKDVVTVVDIEGTKDTIVEKKIDVEDPNVKGGSICHEKKSGTKLMSCKSTHDGEIFADTPGELDDQGPAADLAHSIGVTKGIHCAKGVRPVIVLDKDTITSVRGPEFDQILDFSSNLIENIQDRLNSFSFLFTHFDCSKPEVENYELIKTNILKQAKYEKEKDPNNNRVKLLNFIYFGISGKIDLLKVGAQTEGSYVHIVNPLNPEAIPDILSMIKSRQPIENPSQVFKYNISNASSIFIDHQCVSLQFKISQSIERGNYSQAAECLDLIKLLENRLGLKSLKESYKVSQEEITTHYNQLCSDVKLYLADVLKPACSLSMEQLVPRLSSIKFIYHLMKQRDSEEKTHFTNNNESYDHVIQCLLQISNDCESSFNTIMSFSVLKDQIDKLCSLSKFNDLFTPVKSNAIQSLTKRIIYLIDDHQIKSKTLFLFFLQSSKNEVLFFHGKY